MTRRPTYTMTVVAAAALSISGCTAGPMYQRPVVPTPDRHLGQRATGPASLADTPWWETFSDPALNALIGDAIANNYDVRVAAARVEQSRAQAGIDRSQAYPQAGYAGSVGRAEQPYQHAANALQANVNVSWELDLWGRIRRLNEAARAQFLSTEEARRGVIMSLVADVATAYFTLQGLDSQLAIAKSTTAAFRETADLFNRKLAGGAASALETARAEGALHGVATSIPQLERQIAEQEYQISFLAGRAPGPVTRGGLLDATRLPPQVPAGLPSSLLERRPDVRQAEQSIVAANAQVGVAHASFFPTVSLTGLLGGVSTELSALFGEGRQWSISAGVVGPIFNAGRLRNQQALAVARWDEAKIQYERAVNNALLEVAVGLVAHQKLAEAEASEAKAVAAYREAVRLSNLRYTSGLSAYFEVIDAMQQLLPVELNLATLQRDRLVNYVKLYKALGGGWQVQTEPATK